MAARHTPFPRFEERKHATEDSGWLTVDLGGHEVVARLHMRLKAGPEAAGQGRHALDRLEGTLDEDQLNQLRLLVTELLTNSVRHGSSRGDWITLEVEIYANSMRVVVTDRGPGFALDGTPRPHGDRPGGWGLCLVDSLADRWGVDGNGETAVWLEIDRGGQFVNAA